MNLEFRKKAKRIIRNARMGVIDYAEVWFLLIDAYRLTFNDVPRKLR